MIYTPKQAGVKPVLIVPSGIETTAAQVLVDLVFVLIVPSGIETRSILLNSDQIRGINCT